MINLIAERAVLGAIFMRSDSIATIAGEERLTPDDFHESGYGRVYQTMVDLYDSASAIDTITVAARLDELGLQAPADYQELPACAPASGNHRDYARIVRNLSVRRQLVKHTGEIQTLAKAPTPALPELLAETEKRLLGLTDQTARAGQLAALSGEDEWERVQTVSAGVETVGLSSGFVDLDRLTTGWQPGQLVVVAARPGMGKSVFATNIAEHVAARGSPVAIFSLEMTRDEILRRIVASRARVPYDVLLRGPLNGGRLDKVQKAMQEVTSLPLFVDDSTDLTVVEARAKARRVHAIQPLELVIVDYVQLLRTVGKENRTIEVGNITRGLKVLAQELQVPVLAISQLSRGVENRPDKRPMLVDLRDSGAVEQDADMVMFLYRDGYYDPDTADPDLAECNVAKHRNGDIGKVKLTFRGAYPRFFSYVDSGRFDSVPQDRANSGEDWPF